MARNLAKRHRGRPLNTSVGAHMTKVWGAFLALMLTSARAAEPVELSKKTYKPGGSVVTLGINWGRTWKCGSYENAQLQALTFRKAPLSADNPTTLDLKTPSKLFVDNKFLPYAFVVEPGEYILTGFDVKVARSVRDVGHLKGDESNLLNDGKPTAGSFAVGAGEMVYIGHFGLDCGAEPFLWRYHLENRGEFDRWVSQFRDKYPFASDLKSQFRLFATTTLGNPFSPEGPTK